MGIGLTLVYLAILLISAVLHEIGHGVAALVFGDTTARDRGRLSLNPIRHIEPFFSIILPLILIVSGSPVIFGAARPVPVVVDRLSPRRLGLFMVAFTGPLVNIILAVTFAYAFRQVVGIRGGAAAAEDFGVLSQILAMGAVTNLGLAIFNLFPVPPLDGGQIIGCLLPARLANRFFRLSRFGLIALVILLFSGVIDRFMRVVMNFGLSFLLGATL